MPISVQESSQLNNDVATFPTRTITLASAARRHHNVFTPSPHPTILCVVVAIASVYFLDLHMHSEVTSNATANPPLLLTYSSLLLSLFGVLSSALRVVPAIGIELQDQPFTLVERHSYPSIHVIFQAEMDPVDSHMVRGPSDSPWPSLSKGLRDCSLFYAFASVACLTTQVWLYMCASEPLCVQAAGGIAAAVVCAPALNHLRTLPIPWTDYY